MADINKLNIFNGLADKLRNNTSTYDWEHAHAITRKRNKLYKKTLASITPKRHKMFYTDRSN